MALNARQTAFCREYMVDGIAEQAALRAGYAPKTARHMAHRLLAHVGIKAEIARRQARQEQVAEVTVAEVVAGLRRCALSGNVRAWELLGKHIGMWEERAEGNDSWNRLTVDAAQPED